MQQNLGARKAVNNASFFETITNQMGFTLEVIVK